MMKPKNLHRQRSGNTLPVMHKCIAQRCVAYLSQVEEQFSLAQQSKQISNLGLLPLSAGLSVGLQTKELLIMLWAQSTRQRWQSDLIFEQLKVFHHTSKDGKRFTNASPQRKCLL